MKINQENRKKLMLKYLEKRLNKYQELRNKLSEEQEGLSNEEIIEKISGYTTLIVDLEEIWSLREINDFFTNVFLEYEGISENKAYFLLVGFP